MISGFLAERRVIEQRGKNRWLVGGAVGGAVDAIALRRDTA